MRAAKLGISVRTVSESWERTCTPRTVRTVIPRLLYTWKWVSKRLTKGGWVETTRRRARSTVRIARSRSTPSQIPRMARRTPRTRHGKPRVCRSAAGRSLGCRTVCAGVAGRSGGGNTRTGVGSAATATRRGDPSPVSPTRLDQTPRQATDDVTQGPGSGMAEEVSQPRVHSGHPWHQSLARVTRDVRSNP